jgi:hypothetical protein
VGATGVLHDSSTQALGTSALVHLFGDYTGCIGHDDTDKWRVDINPPMSPFPNLSPLTVTKGDTSCKLSLETMSDGTTTYLNTLSPRPMTATFSNPPMEYDTAAGGAQFFANALLSSVSFDDDFVVEVFTSDDSSQVAGPSSNAILVDQETNAQPVAAPDYVLTFDTIAISQDASHNVLDATGAVTFTANVQPGELYHVVLGPFAATFANDDDAFSGTDFSIDTTPLSIDASAFALTGTLPLIRTVIIQHFDGDTEDGTYESFQFTFNP